MTDEGGEVTETSTSDHNTDLNHVEEDYSKRA